jgi:S1-C subfamily serine protease
VRPVLGVELDEQLNRRITDRLGTGGVVVLGVTAGSAAERAGLRGLRRTVGGAIVPGDIIVAIDGTAVDSVARLLSRLDDHDVGDMVRLTVLRDGKRTDVTVALQAGSQ